MPTKASTSPKAKAPAKSTARPDADPALDLDSTASEAETGSTSAEPTASEAPETGASEPETSSETEAVSASGGAEPEQDADKTASETVPAATGVRQIYLLKQSKLGPVGKVVRLTHRKIADLGLKHGEDFRTPTALELAIGG
ncbi:MAG: hypothetical protein CMH91_01455 [Oceanicaulis sp.]|uniref:hypothetical protein n=1 Tax=unclassified Oceanicaulis TaxID=2632123 RepID=UPI000C639E63|nr:MULTISPECIES: hypothetical protein [unclassified Oceanicaulis]MBC37714.1 hypothetical protein [Oceanicaulis sp.]HBU63426.1 hypothetical protein [Oceanicaulis sp.]